MFEFGIELLFIIFTCCYFQYYHAYFHNDKTPQLPLSVLPFIAQYNEQRDTKL